MVRSATPATNGTARESTLDDSFCGTAYKNVHKNDDEFLYRNVRKQVDGHIYKNVNKTRINDTRSEADAIDTGGNSSNHQTALTAVHTLTQKQLDARLIRRRNTDTDNNNNDDDRPIKVGKYNYVRPNTSTTYDRPSASKQLRNDNDKQADNKKARKD